MDKHIHLKDFRVEEDSKVNLKKWPTEIKPFYHSKDHYQGILAQHIKELSARQNMLYAHDRYALLLIFQAMDAAGKDSAIKHVMSGVNPQGCQVFSFKHPGDEDLDHDFLWRTTRHLPERGQIGIFNRSYYEEVLIVRVRPEILRAQKIPEELSGTKTFWQDRYRSIRNFEKHLYINGTRIIKFFLHISKEEQRKRFLKRIDEPDKNWKFGATDIDDRKLWPKYMKAYEDCLAETSTANAPWYVIPSNDKGNAQLIISKVILDTLKEMKMAYPKINPGRRKELLIMRKQLIKEKK